MALSFYIRGAPRLTTYAEILPILFSEISKDFIEQGKKYSEKRIHQFLGLAKKCNHRRLIERFEDDAAFLKDHMDKEQFLFNQGCRFFLYSARNYKVLKKMKKEHKALFLQWLDLFNLSSKCNYYAVATKEMGYIKDEIAIPWFDKNTYVYSVIPGKTAPKRLEVEKRLREIKEELKTKAEAFCDQLEIIRKKVEGDGRLLRIKSQGGEDNGK